MARGFLAELAATSFGFRGAHNVAAWGVAAAVAWVAWVKPAQKRTAEERAAAELAALRGGGRRQGEGGA